MVTSLDSRLQRSEAPTSSARRPAAVTSTAWSAGADLAVADWIRQGRWLGALGRGSGWWIGDWIRYGNARYGERYGLAVRVTGYDVQSLRNMAYVAGRFDAQRRRDRLSFSHHAELAGLPVEEQDLWLDRAEASALSVGSLRSELRQTRRRLASRPTLTAAPGKRERAVKAVRPKTAPIRRDVNLPASPSNPIEAEVVCPECGHHFAQPSTMRRQIQPHGEDRPAD